MEKKKLIAALAESEEDEVLLAKVLDRISAGEQKNIPAATCFLTGREQVLAHTLLERAGLEAMFFGGTAGAERAVAAYIPDYYEAQEYLQGEDGPVAALRATFSDYDTLSHRDFLGSLMGQGIRREVVGDIYVGLHSCDFVVLRDMVPYLLTNLVSAGRAKLQVEEIPLAALEVPEQQVKTVSATVSTLRLDSILASGFSLGRSKAAGYVTSGRTEVNHASCVKPDKLVAEGDTISVRGLGKMQVKEIRGQTKKGRTAVVLERYL